MPNGSAAVGGTELDLSDSAETIVIEPENEAEVSPLPFEPLVVYNKYLDRAIAGDAAGQYAAYKIAQYCRFAIQSESERRTVADEGASQEILDNSKKRSTYCESLFSEYPDLGALADQWYQLATESDYVMLRTVLNDRRLSDPEQERLVHAALRAAMEFDEPLLRADAYGSAAAFEARREDPNYPVRQLAWVHVKCAAEPLCNATEVKNNMRLELPPHHFEEISQVIEEINAAISSRRVGDLGFQAIPTEK